MAQVTVQEEVAASASAVWEILSDFGRMTERLSAIESCELEGEGIGCVRTLRFVGGDLIRERLEAFDDAARSFRFVVLGPEILPVKDCYSSLTVSEIGADRCRVEWTATFEPVGVSTERAGSMLRGVYLGITHTLQELLDR